MTTTQTTAPAQPRADNGQRLTFVRALHGEWIKLTTVRSTWWSIGIAAFLTIGMAALFALAVRDFGGEEVGFGPIDAVVSPVQFTMLLAGIIGAIAVTGEYSTGMIRSTLAANPVRGSVLAAKAVVLAVFLFLASLVIFGLAAGIVTLIVAPDLSIDWADPESSIFPILVTCLSMSVFALLGVSFGFILRSGAGAIAATVGLLFVLPTVSGFLTFAGESWAWLVDIFNYLPASAASSAITPGEWATLEPSVAYLTLACWVAAGLLGAWGVLRTRDA